MTALLSVEHLVKHFPAGARPVRAVDGVSLDIAAGRTLGLVGESGSGKTTLARLIVRLIEPTAGRILFEGSDLTALRGRRLRAVRRHLQIVFQDPAGALNPRATVGRLIDDPLRVNRFGDRRRRRDEVARLLERVGLDPAVMTRFPHEFSGGQRQRIGIARALALRPKLIACDEPVSALDVSVRAQILNLLVGLQRELDLAYLFVSHDLAVVQRIADRIAVMYLGQIVELADRDAFWSAPRHPYSQALIAAVPVPDPKAARHRRRLVLPGDVPSPRDPPAACRFHTRCPFVMPICRRVEPLLVEYAPGRSAACHLVPGVTEASLGRSG